MSEIQSIQFDKSEWTPKEINMWLLDHDLYPIKKMRKGPNYYRVRIRDPNLFNKLRNKKISDKGIIFTFGFY